MAGPFDLSGPVRDSILNDETLSQPYQLPYVIGGLTHYEPVGLSFADTLRDDLATTIPPLFNGEISGAEINQQLPSQPSGILSDTALSALADPTHPLVLALQRNDLLDWILAAPCDSFTAAMTMWSHFKIHSAPLSSSKIKGHSPWN